MKSFEMDADIDGFHRYESGPWKHSEALNHTVAIRNSQWIKLPRSKIPWRQRDDELEHDSDLMIEIHSWSAFKHQAK